MSVLMCFFVYYWSLISYWVCIVFNFKGLDYEVVFVDLCKLEQYELFFCVCNFFSGVFLFEVGGWSYVQLMVIIEWLEECYLQLLLLFLDCEDCFVVCEFVFVIVIELYVLLNLWVLCYLKCDLGYDQFMIEVWYWYWLQKMFELVEQCFV